MLEAIAYWSEWVWAIGFIGILFIWGPPPELTDGRWWKTGIRFIVCAEVFCLLMSFWNYRP